LAFQFTLQKILEFKEKIKQEAEGKFAEASKAFEEEATKLYHLLKKKETYEATCAEQLQTKASILYIQQTQILLMRLQQDIHIQQQKTHVARDKMRVKQDELLTLSMELKKYEKLKEVQLLAYMEWMKREESKQMDEIAVQNYMNR